MRVRQTCLHFAAYRFCKKLHWSDFQFDNKSATIMPVGVNEQQHWRTWQVCWTKKMFVIERDSFLSNVSVEFSSYAAVRICNFDCYQVSKNVHSHSVQSAILVGRYPERMFLFHTISRRKEKIVTCTLGIIYFVISVRSFKWRGSLVHRFRLRFWWWKEPLSGTACATIAEVFSTCS